MTAPPLETWRSLPCLTLPGEQQMAIDRWLLAQHLNGAHPPCVRFYQWSEPTLSLGYHQKQIPQAWAQGAIPLVRRPSGGRAVFHQGDLTYAVVFSSDRPRRVSYEWVCGWLIKGWQRLGIDLHYGDRHPAPDRQEPNCFRLATEADLITSQGRKFIGNAQLKRGKAVLQHGSMQLAWENQHHDQVFPQGDRPTPLLDPATGQPFQRDTIIHTLMATFCEHFQVTVNPAPLTADEWQAIATLEPLDLHHGSAHKKS